MTGMLVIVPCGQQKVWDKNPHAGSVAASNAYIGSPFKVNKEYAERFADSWVILSAKYGFIPPHFIISSAYNVTFKSKATRPISLSVLREQIYMQGLDRFELVVGLGGKDYRAIIEDVFNSSAAEIVFPFAGLPIGKAMQATKMAITSGELPMA